MADFKVFAYNQAIMTRLGIYSHRLSEPTDIFFKSFVPYFNLSFLGINIIFCGVLIFRGWPNLDLILEPLLIIIAAVQSGGMFLSVGLNVESVKLLHLSLQKVVDDEGSCSFLNYFFLNFIILKLTMLKLNVNLK